jgi:hypothetical protein
MKTDTIQTELPQFNINVHKPILYEISSYVDPITLYDLYTAAFWKIKYCIQAKCQ